MGTFGYLEIASTSVKMLNLWTSWPTQFALMMLTNVQLHLVVFHGKLMTLIVEQKLRTLLEDLLISMPSTTDLQANVPNGNSFKQVNPASLGLQGRQWIPLLICLRTSKNPPEIVPKDVSFWFN